MDRPRDALPEGAKLAGYVIGHVLGRGGFGVTYFGHDALFPDSKVAIKEFLPAGLAVREAGAATVHPSDPLREFEFKAALARFEDEARTLVALRHPNVVEVQRYIEANGTAYVVMKFEEGRSLSELLAGGRTLSATELGDIVAPLLDGLEAVHRRNYLHRDIKPGNIYIRAAEGSPVLLDFGAARQAMGADRKTTLTEIVTPGYAPFEQYFKKGEQGPWTDIYALGATFYRCIAGHAPPEAPERTQRDEMVPARAVGEGRYPGRLLAAIDAMLSVDEKKRPQSVDELRKLLATDTERGVEANRQVPTPNADREARAHSEPAQAPAPRSSQAAASATAAGAQESKQGTQRGSSDTKQRKRSWTWIAEIAIFGSLAIAVYLEFRNTPSPPPDRAVASPPVSRPPIATGPDAACRDGLGWRAGCTFRDCADCPEMVVIPAGTFTMGSPTAEVGREKSEGPQHQVTIAKPFALGKHEVTFAEWDACTTAGGCTHRPGDHGWGRGRRPVVNVSWSDAKAYAAWLSRKTGKNYRLPSEAEWEYAARAGTTTPFSTGATISTDQANYSGNAVYGNGQKGVYRERTVAVGSFAANRFGLHDMHGNVWELVEDCWHESYIGAPTDGRPWSRGDCAQYVRRGGSWVDAPLFTRSAFRIPVDSGYRNFDVGFRVARTY